jgi:hypothetical protein
MKNYWEKLIQAVTQWDRAARVRGLRKRASRYCARASTCREEADYYSGKAENANLMADELEKK